MFFRSFSTTYFSFMWFGWACSRKEKLQIEFLRPMNYAIYARLHENFINLLVLFAVTSIYEWHGQNFFNKLVPFRNSELMCGKKGFSCSLDCIYVWGVIEWVDKRFKSSHGIVGSQNVFFFQIKYPQLHRMSQNFHLKSMSLQWWVSHVKINTNQFNACKSQWERECFCGWRNF